MAADHDQFEDGVNDGDTISDGWYNGCYTKVTDTSTGHNHDGTNSRKLGPIYANFCIDESAVDDTEYSGSGTKKTYTFTPTSTEHIIIGARIDGELKCVGGEGNEWGKLWLSVSIKSHTDYTGDADCTITSPFAQVNKDLAYSNAYSMMSLMPFDSETNNQANGLATGKSTYSFSVILGTRYGGGTPYVRNLKLTVYWLDGATKTTNSGKFS